MRNTGKPPTLDQAMEQVVAQLDGPITFDEFVERVLAIWPSKAKTPQRNIRSHMQYRQIGVSLAFLDSQTLIPLRLAMQGVRFRITLDRQEVEQGVVAFRPNFEFFVRWGVPIEEMQLLDAAGQPLAFRVVTLEPAPQGFWEMVGQKAKGFDLGDWFRAIGVRRRDSILVTVEDWERGHFRLEHEPAHQRRKREREIQRKNQALADAVYELLESSTLEEVFSRQAITTAYARMSDPRGYPGDCWAEVIGRDPRMKTDGLLIYYADRRSPLEEIALFESLFEEEEQIFPEERFSSKQAKKVYRLKAAMKDRPGLWRRIEIQGDQTLADFDAILRDAFQLDPYEHLSGFWKRVKRGKTGQRAREVDLGHVDPLGEGPAAGLHVAGLGLQPGDTLKYVYDFGDWLEHQITLEEIGDPKVGAEYPRIVERNKPKYRYCQACTDKGRKTVATWICVDCSNETGKPVLLCEDCLTREHEEHYAEEILY
ncbi:MAG: IS1096 element passenger TnpR family protein [Anaerolineae bacterium]